MTSRVKIAVLSLAVWLLCGMSSMFDIEVISSNQSQIIFQLKTRNFVHPLNQIEINSFLVAGKDELGHWDYKHPMWHFKLTPGDAKPLSRVIYGQIPAGYTETTKARGLIPGAAYLAVGVSPGSTGSAEFVGK